MIEDDHRRSETKSSSPLSPRECAFPTVLEASSSRRMPRPAKEVLCDLARALARQAAQEDYAAEQAREATSQCGSPSMPGSARTSRTSDL